MEQPFGKYLMFRNRLEKLHRHIGRQARRQNISCYRLYDHDLPEFPFLIEVYEDKLSVSEYKRRHGLSDEAHAGWLEGCLQVMSEVLGIDTGQIFIRLRQRKEGRQGQYQKRDEQKNEFVVKEAGLNFIVNLTDYLDTGLFLDHRITRSMVRELSRDKRVLNLFCYTGSFSVYAADGGASKVVSVDLSNTYLAWTQRNLDANFPGLSTHHAIPADVLSYLKTIPSNSFDLVILDPPTFSNSKRMEGFLDIQHDHVGLINDCLRILDDQGLLFFSTNYTKFKLDATHLNARDIRDITAATTPFDFAGKLKRQCFRVRK